MGFKSFLTNIMDQGQKNIDNNNVNTNTSAITVNDLNSNGNIHNMKIDNNTYNKNVNPQDSIPGPVYRNKNKGLLQPRNRYVQQESVYYDNNYEANAPVPRQQEEPISVEPFYNHNFEENNHYQNTVSNNQFYFPQNNYNNLNNRNINNSQPLIRGGNFGNPLHNNSQRSTINNFNSNSANNSQVTLFDSMGNPVELFFNPQSNNNTPTGINNNHLHFHNYSSVHEVNPIDSMIEYDSSLQNKALTSYNNPYEYNDYGKWENMNDFSVSKKEKVKWFASNWTRKESKKYSKEEFNEKIPRTIASEIKAEKFRSLIMIIIGSAGILSTVFFIALYYIAKNDIVNGHEVSSIFDMGTQYIPHPFLTITLLILSLLIFFSGIFNFSKVRLDSNNYLEHFIKGEETIPHFIINNYKKMESRKIIYNWVCFPSYVFGTIVLLILYGFQKHAGEPFVFFFWSLGNVKDLTTEITINIIILMSVFGLHVSNVIFTKRRKNNIIGYYGYEIVSPEELTRIRKKTNRICFIVFLICLIILTIVITLPILIAKKRKRGHWVWPWKSSK